MKYTTKIGQPQFVGKVKIEPQGGDLTEKQVEAIKADPWGKELIEKGILKIADGKAPEKPSSNNNTPSNDEGKKGQEGK
jgi:hypothetical protein